MSACAEEFMGEFGIIIILDFGVDQFPGKFYIMNLLVKYRSSPINSELYVID